MNKCLKIQLTLEMKEGFLQSFIQHNARLFDLEGTAQFTSPDKLRVVVCGEKDLVDNFIDIIHKESLPSGITDIEIEPYIKDKDYRGVFRVIE
ncbi:acylphosphatase [Candidatus Dependentiae bacterium]|nr:acylphosphatase [Candidatus Dependentiae bacterium]